MLRTASDLLATPPTTNQLWRSIAITTALARLGERGLPADPVVRIGLGPGLAKRILGDAAFFWSAAQADHLTRNGIPPLLGPWCDLFDEEPGLRGVHNPSPGHVLGVALAGQTGALVNRWLQSAAVGHIVGWKISQYLEVERSPGNVVLSGGKDATRWVCERFTRTYPDEWRIASLSWEMAFNRRPHDTASRVGVPLELLMERVVTDEMVANAIASKLIEKRGAGDEFEDDLDGAVVIASLAAMLDSGAIGGARAMARRLLESRPADVHLGMAYAFCTIPISSREARSVLDGLGVGKGSIEAVVRDLNRAACALFEGHPEEAYEITRSVGRPARDECVWLWDPEAALAGRPQVVFEPASIWCARVDRIVHGQST